jgi:cysteine-rich repeat protein
VQIEGDGCGKYCNIELGWHCNNSYVGNISVNIDRTFRTVGGTDSTCYSIIMCGDGVVSDKPGGEQCDDRNIDDGDGSSCMHVCMYACLSTLLFRAHVHVYRSLVLYKHLA